MKSPKRDTKKEENKDKEKEIIYPVPAKPLDFTFKNIKTLEALILTEARSGERRSIEDIEKEEKMKNEKTLKIVNTETSVEEEEVIEKKQKKKVEDNSEVVEMRIFEKGHDDNRKGKSQFLGNNTSAPEEKKQAAAKKKVVYSSFTNAVILHDNEIRTLENIDQVFNQILLEPTFLAGTGRQKIELIQWLDLSHNYLTEIHKDIQNLPFLKILYLHANYIAEIEAVKNLSNCPCLINLTLHGNSIEHIKGYRLFIIEMLPKLEKLDFTLVSEKELDIIYYKGCRNGEIRDKETGKVISYPKLDERFKKKLKEEKSDKKQSD